MSLIKLYKSYVDYLDRGRILKLTRKLIKDNWETASTDVFNSYCFEKKFTVGKLHFSVLRAIRADLIEVRFIVEDSNVIAYVDQSHQYNNMLGINDVEISITYKDFLNAIQTSNTG